MSKHTKALKARLDEIDAELDKTTKDKKRDRLKAERDEIKAELHLLKHPVIENIEPSLIDEVTEEAAKAVGEALDRAIDEAFKRPIDHAALDAEAGERHLAHLERVGELNTEREELDKVATDDTNKKKVIKAANERLAEIDAELATLRKATEARTLAVAHETTGRNLKTLGEKSAETDEEIKARVLARRAARASQEEPGSVSPEPDYPASYDEMAATTAENLKAALSEPERRPEGGQTEREAGVIHAEDEPVTVKKRGKGKTASQTIADMVAVADDPDEVLIAAKKAGIDVKDEDLPPIVPVERVVLIDPEAVQPRDRWGRPEIVRPDGTTKGYRRMTTFIDVIDDKDNLVKWKGRVILAGVAATEQKIAGDGDLLTIDEVGTESIIERVETANQEMESAIKGAKKLHKKGKLTETELQDELDDAEKAHRNALTDLAEEAFQAGDGYLKAETGTRIHKLTEFVDRGEELPDDTTDSERRDIAAYVAARDALGVEVKLIEQFVVIDELEVGGTLDRLIRIDSPSLGRRVTAIGDVKTGRMDFGAGKMARQLAGYAKGKTYDWRDPEHVRKPLRANQQVGYIFNVPAGQGVCFVYELDLTLGARGLKLCKEIFDYRAETSTLKKVGTLIHSTKEG